MQLEVGTVLEGKVTGITKFGAFVALPEGKSGLIHISEVANTFVNDVHEFLSEGQTVKVKVLSISPEGKISLSAKRAEETKPASPRPGARRTEERPRTGAPAARPAPAARTAPAAAAPYVPTRSGDQGFEDKLKQFMQESDSKMSGNKLFEQQKKSRNRRK